MQTLPSDSGSGLVLAPFRGIRYARDRVSGIANVTSPPYDVISGGILENLRAADPHNVVRLILPGEDADASQAAASLLREWLSAGVLIRDRMPALYLYEQPGAPLFSEWRELLVQGDFERADRFAADTGLTAMREASRRYQSHPARPGMFTHWGAGFKFGASLLGLPVGDHPARPPQTAFPDDLKPPIREAYVASGFVDS